VVDTRATIYTNTDLRRHLPVR